MIKASSRSFPAKIAHVSNYLFVFGAATFMNCYTISNGQMTVLKSVENEFILLPLPTLYNSVKEPIEDNDRVYESNGLA